MYTCNDIKHASARYYSCNMRMFGTHKKSNGIKRIAITKINTKQNSFSLNA